MHAARRLAARAPACPLRVLLAHGRLRAVPGGRAEVPEEPPYCSTAALLTLSTAEQRRRLHTFALTCYFLGVRCGVFLFFYGSPNRYAQDYSFMG